MKKSNISWETIIEERASLKDIDNSTIDKFKELAKKRFPIAAKEKSITGLLEKLHLLNKGKLTRAAILLFGKDSQKFYTGSYIKIGRFKDEATLLSMDDIYGNLFQQAEQAMEILKKKYLHSEIKIESLHRSEELEYPELALREALINAIVHRDYSDTHTQLKIYPDHLSLWNNGELTTKLTFEKLKKPHTSYPRNELIADVFYKAAYIEAWGTGTVKMIAECKKAGLPEPIYKQESGGIEVTFLKDLLNEEYLNKLSLNDRQIKAVLYIKEHGKIANSEYQTIANTSKRTASNDLQELTEKGIILKVGATGKGTQYIIQTGNNGAKRAIKNPDALDKKLMLLEKELEVIPPDDEIKVYFNNQVFFKIFDSWQGELLEKLILTGQKFNRFFNETNHHIYVISGIGKAHFKGESPKEIIKELRADCWKNKSKILGDVTVELYLFYGKLRKGGLKTFGCTYKMEIEFKETYFRIYLDEFSSENNTMKNKIMQYEYLLHKPLQKEEIDNLTQKLGENIFLYIDSHTKKQGLR